MNGGWLNPSEYQLAKPVWLDDALLAINKPPGLHTLPDGYDKELPHLRRLLEPLYGRLWLVHRLDRDTSGILLLARSAEAHRALSLQFEKRQTRKIYHALVIGAPPWEQQTVKLRLRADGDRRHRTVIDHRKGKPAITHLRTLERFGRFALLEVIPETGRTHQIRAHLWAKGFPLVCDALYGGGDPLTLRDIQPDRLAPEEGEVILLVRPALHALALSISHPLTGEELRLEAPYPGDFAAALEALRQQSSIPDIPSELGTSV